MGPSTSRVGRLLSTHLFPGRVRSPLTTSRPQAKNTGRSMKMSLDGETGGFGPHFFVLFLCVLLWCCDSSAAGRDSRRWADACLLRPSTLLSNRLADFS